MHQHRYRFPDPKRLALNIRPSPKNSTAQHGVRADNSQKTTAQQLLANSYADSKRGRMQHQGPEPLQEWFCGYRRGRTRGGKAFAGLLASRQSVGSDISPESAASAWCGHRLDRIFPIFNSFSALFIAGVSLMRGLGSYLLRELALSR